MGNKQTTGRGKTHTGPWWVSMLEEEASTTHILPALPLLISSSSLKPLGEETAPRCALDALDAAGCTPLPHASIPLPTPPPSAPTPAPPPPVKRSVYTLEEIGKEGVGADEVGGKGHHLGRISQAVEGVDVPDAIVVSSSVYRQVVGPLVEGVGGEGESPAEVVAQVRDAIGRVEMEEAAAAVRDSVAAFVQAAVAERPDTLFAVRSSATVEDGGAKGGKGGSMAGLAETFLCVPGRVDDVCHKIVECWASLWSERVGVYLAGKETDADWVRVLGEVGMAVVVQVMVVADRAGVTFTTNPLSGNERTMVVEAVHGLGEGLVSGAVDGAKYEVCWGSLAPGRRPEDLLIVPASSEGNVLQASKFDYVGGAVVETELEETTEAGTFPYGNPESGWTRYAELGRICQASLAIARASGRPQDVEWVVERGTGRVFVTQARPITAITINRTDVEFDWASGFTRKSWLSMTLTSATGYHASRLQGTPAEEVAPFDVKHNFTRDFYGIIYINRLGVSVLDHAQKHSEMLEVKAASGALARRAVALCAHIETEIIPRCWTMLSLLDEMPMHRLALVLRTLLSERLELAYHSFTTGNVARKAVAQATAEGLDVVAALHGLSPRASLPTTKLDALVESFMASGECAAELLDWVDGEEGSLDGVGEKVRELSPEVGEGLDAYVIEFFYLSAHDEDIGAQDRWYDCPGIPYGRFVDRLCQRVGGAGASGGASGSASEGGEGSAGGEVGGEVVEMLRTYTLAKERVHETYCKLNMFLRHGLERFAARAWAAGAEMGAGIGGLTGWDVHHLSFEFVTMWLERVARGKLRDKAAGREFVHLEGEREVFQHAVIKDMFAKWETPSVLRPRMSAGRHVGGRRSRGEGSSEKGGSEFVGKPASAGNVTGRAVVAETLEDALERVEEGDILVTKMTTPAWTLLFARLGGLIIATGSVLSHGAVVARELDLPCVILRNALSKVGDGDMVEVGGGEGVVRICGSC